MRQTKKAQECYVKAAELSPAYKEMLGMMKAEDGDRRVWTQSFAAEAPLGDGTDLKVRDKDERPPPQEGPPDHSAETAEKEWNEGGKDEKRSKGA